MDTSGTKAAAESLISDLQRLRGAACAGCGKPMCSHQSLMAIVMGFKNAPRCAACLSAGWTGSPSQFRDSVLACIRLRPCYQEAWNWANCEAGLSEDELPSLGFEPRNAQNDRDDSIPAADAAWDAGDQGCGELALELRMRLERLKPGEVLLLTTRDLGAPQDVPAWCGLTGHALLREAVPHYWIRRAD